MPRLADSPCDSSSYTVDHSLMPMQPVAERGSDHDSRPLKKQKRHSLQGAAISAVATAVPDVGPSASLATHSELSTLAERKPSMKEETSPPTPG